MPRKRKSDTNEILELKEKIRKLEKRQSSFRRIRTISSSSSSSESRSPRASHHPVSRCSSRASAPKSGRSSRSRQRNAHRSPAMGITRYSQDARFSDESDDAYNESPARVCTETVQAQIHASPANNQQSIPDASSSHAFTLQPQSVAPGSDEVIEIADPVNGTEPPIADESAEPELSSTILDILGDDPSVPKTYGKDIQKDLAIRFDHIATNGLSKELRKELRDKYPVPANCTLIDAPQINPEVKAAISETTSKRLGGMEQKQKQLASAIACLGEAITLLISQNNSDPTLLQLLMDTGRLICDTQYSDSLTRRFFILASLKKEMKDQLLQTKIDSFLFGKNLSETLKSAKAITKSGADLKQKYFPPKLTTWKSNNQKKTINFKNLNQKPTPSSHRSTGSTGPRTPAPRNQPVSSSRSSRPTSKRSHH